MNKKQFIKKFYQNLRKNKSITNLQKQEYARKITDIFFNFITNSLQVGDKVELRKFGVFQVKEYNFSRKDKKKEKFPIFKMSSIIRKKLESKNDSLD